MNSWFIYVLKDPRNSQVRYVGWTGNTVRRFRQHLRDGRKRPSAKARWIHELSRAGETPILQIVEVGEGAGWNSAEKRWIKHFRDAGAALVNATSGGGWEPPSGPVTLFHLRTELKKLMAKYGRAPAETPVPMNIDGLLHWFQAAAEIQPPGNAASTSRKRKEG